MKKNKITYLSLCLVFLLVITSVQAKGLSKIEFDTKIDSNVKLSGKLKHFLKTADNEQVKSIVVLKKGAILPTNENISMKKAKNLHDIVFVNALPNDYASLFENPSVEKIITDAPVKVPEADIGALTTEPDTSLDDLLTQESALKHYLAGYTGDGIKVAIVDSGIDDAAQANVIYEQDWTGEGTNDFAGHGTFMWSVVNKIAENAEFLNLKVLDQNGEGVISSVLEAISVALDPDDNELTDDGADIILLSLGITPATADDPEAISFFTEQVNDFAETQLIIAGAGNGGPFENSIVSPADGEHVLSLGAADASLSSVAVFSSRGPVDNPIKPDFIAPGSYIEGQKPAGVDFGIPIDETHAYASGTSVSAAYGVGVAALILEKGEDVSDVFSTYAVDLGESENAQGQGLVSMEEQVDLGEYDQVFWKVKNLKNNGVSDKIERLCIILPPDTDVIKAEFTTKKNVERIEFMRNPYFFTNQSMIPLSPVEGNNIFGVLVPVRSDVFVNFTFGKLDSELWPDILSCDQVETDEEGNFVKAQSLQTNWEERLISGNFIGPQDVVAAHIDDDEHIDFVLSSYYHINETLINNDITFWRNYGQGWYWYNRSIANGVKGRYYIFVDDIDGDNDNDVVGAGAYYHISESTGSPVYNVSWWEQGDNYWSNWDKHQVETSYTFPTDIVVEDVVGDNRPDIICSAYYDYLSVWENNGSWIKTNANYYYPISFFLMSIKAGDINGDNSKDLVTTRYFTEMQGDYYYRQGMLIWWEDYFDDGSLWYPHLVDVYLNGTFFKPDVIDVDGDGDLDIIGGYEIDPQMNGSSTSYIDIAWWENVDGSGSEWEKHIIDTGSGIYFPKFIATDFDYDGDIDLISIYYWWERADTDEEVWNFHQYDTSGHVVFGLDVADVNNDGYLDILTGYGYENEIKWWKNPGAVPTMSITDYTGEEITGRALLPGGTFEAWVTLKSPIAFSDPPDLYSITQTEDWSVGAFSLGCSSYKPYECNFILSIRAPMELTGDNYITVTYRRDDGIDMVKGFGVNILEGVLKICPYSLTPLETTYYGSALPSEETEQILAHMNIAADNCNVPIDLDVKGLPAGWKAGLPVTAAAGISGEQFVSFNVPTDEKVGLYQESFRIDATTSLGINRKTANLNLVVENPIPIVENDDNAFLKQYDDEFNETSDEYFDLGRLFGFHSVSVSESDDYETGYFVSPGLTYFVNEKLEKRSKPALGGVEEAVDQPAVEWGINTSANYYTHFTALVNWLKSVEGDFRTNPPKELCFIAGTDVNNIGLKAYLTVDADKDEETKLRTSRVQIKSCDQGTTSIDQVYALSKSLSTTPENYFGDANFLRFDFSIDVPSTASINDEYEAFGIIKVTMQDDTTEVKMPFRVSAKVWYDYLTVTTQDIHSNAKDLSITLVETTDGVEGVTANLVDEFTKRRNGKVVFVDRPNIDPEHPEEYPDAISLYEPFTSTDANDYYNDIFIAKKGVEYPYDATVSIKTWNSDDFDTNLCDENNKEIDISSLLNAFEKRKAKSSGTIKSEYITINGCRARKTANKVLYAENFVKSLISHEKNNLQLGNDDDAFILIIANDNEIPYSRVIDGIWHKTLSQAMGCTVVAGTTGVIYGAASMNALLGFTGGAATGKICDSLLTKDDIATYYTKTLLVSTISSKKGYGLSLEYEGKRYLSDIYAGGYKGNEDDGLDKYIFPEIPKVDQFVFGRLPRQYEKLSFIKQHLKSQLSSLSSSTSKDIFYFNTKSNDKLIDRIKSDLESEGHTVAEWAHIVEHHVESEDLENRDGIMLFSSGSPLYQSFSSDSDDIILDNDFGLSSDSLDTNIPDTYGDDNPIIIALGEDNFNGLELPKHYLQKLSGLRRDERNDWFGSWYFNLLSDLEQRKTNVDAITPWTFDGNGINNDLKFSKQAYNFAMGLMTKHPNVTSLTPALRGARAVISSSAGAPNKLVTVKKDVVYDGLPGGIMGSGSFVNETKDYLGDEYSEQLIEGIFNDEKSVGDAILGINPIYWEKIKYARVTSKFRYNDDLFCETFRIEIIKNKKTFFEAFLSAVETIESDAAINPFIGFTVDAAMNFVTDYCYESERAVNYRRRFMYGAIVYGDPKTTS